MGETETGTGATSAGTVVSQQGEYSPRQKLFMKVSMKVITSVNLALLAISGGRIGYRFMGQSVLVLRTRGRKSGKPYRTPLFYMADGPNVVLVASRAGTTVHPAWLLNTLAAETVEVQQPTGTRSMRGHIAEGAERERLWPKLIQMFPTWEDVQQKSPRRFPVLVLEPADAAGTQASAGGDR